MSIERDRRRTRGVTLIELLVALGLAAALLASVITFLRDLETSRDRIQERSGRDRGVDSFLDAIEIALATCVLDAVGAAGISGDAASCTIRSSTVEPALALAPSARPFPVATVAWFGFDEETGSLLLRRGAGAVDALPVGATALRVRYHDGSEWAESYDALERGRLPTAVDVSIDVEGDTRRRIIVVPDAAPAELMPAAGRSER